MNKEVSNRDSCTSSTTIKAKKIYVIADDLSGAAELAGIAASRGLRTEVQTVLCRQTVAEVIVIDTQSRALSAGDASAKVAALAKEIQSLAPAWIYKKTDSVLRGHVRAELEAYMSTIEVDRVMFIPANPGKQRIIREGQYFIQGKPLHETSFVNDPEYPRLGSLVIELIGNEGVMPMNSIGVAVRCPPNGIAIPDVIESDDLRKRAREVDSNTGTAGAGEFFGALLDEWMKADRLEPITAGEFRLNHDSKTGILFICGSLAAWSHGIQTLAAKHHIPVFTLPDHDPWADAVVPMIQEKGVSMMAIGRPTFLPNHPNRSNARIERDDGDEKSRPTSEKARGEVLLQKLIEAATTVVDRVPIENILIEGGSTATAFIESMGWKRFAVESLNLEGVGVLRPVTESNRMRLFVKPGSYPWPEEIWSGFSR